MAVCLQSGGLIDTGSLSVQDGLQLNQFGINNNSPNLPISSEREQAQIVSTFWMFFLSFLSVEPHYSSHFSLFAFSSSISLSVSLSPSLCFSTFPSHSLSSRCFLFIFILFFISKCLPLSPLIFFPSPFLSVSLSLLLSVSVFLF